MDRRAFTQHAVLMRLHGTRDGREQQSGDHPRELPRIGGWLLVYIAALALFTLHGAWLTVASIVIYAHPVAAGLHSFVPLSFLLFYVITNVVLIIYAALLLALMRQRRRSAIVNNLLFNILSVTFLLAWHLFREKSIVGTLVDSPRTLSVPPMSCSPGGSGALSLSGAGQAPSKRRHSAGRDGVRSASGGFNGTSWGCL
jgi:hypothetical protein